MRYGILAISFFISSFAYTVCSGQQEDKYIFRHIDQTNGLLHNLIISIAQDSRGFVWILTPNGLQRYDGSSFVNYLYDINDPGALPFIADSHLYTDRKNNQLWRISSSIEKFNPEKNNFFLCNNDELIKEPRYSFETYNDSLNHPWLVGKLGVFRFESNDEKIKPLFVTGSYPDLSISGSFSADDGDSGSWLTGWAYGCLL